jgi:hypothetical protein
MKLLPSIALIASMFQALAAEDLPVAEAGKPFPAYTVKDAFDASHTLGKDTRVVIIASEKDVSGSVNDWLKAKGKDYLPTNKAEYVSDITPMPAIITSLFAKPKMKKYPFTILLADDSQFAKTYPAQKGKIAVFQLDEKHTLTAVSHVATTAEVEKLVEKK